MSIYISDPNTLRVLMLSLFDSFYPLYHHRLMLDVTNFLSTSDQRRFGTKLADSAQTWRALGRPAGHADAYMFMIERILQGFLDRSAGPSPFNSGADSQHRQPSSCS